MDPQTAAFTPQGEIWRLSETMRTFQQTQQDHSDRLARLERRQDGDARIKSVWGPQQPSQVDFSSFDDDEPSNNLVRGLQLDAEDEPRRLGAASRANSVRFDESANQGQWNHAQRGSVDFLSRASSSIGGIGGHPMFERSTSHKSEGRQSSAGQSASGRANSMGLESSQILGNSYTDLPGLAPGMMLLGPVPSIIRCWITMNFRHDALLYAAVCTGSYKSYVDMRLIEQLGLSSQIRHDISGNSKIKLPVYLPEAITQPASSRPNSPTPRLPCVTVDFLIVDRNSEQPTTKAIQIFVGSDTLRRHSADVLLSTNCVNLFDDDKNKLSVPLVRPESDETFKTLCITSVPISAPKHPIGFNSASQSTQDLTSLARSISNGFEIGARHRASEITPPGSEPEAAKEHAQEIARSEPAESAEPPEPISKDDALDHEGEQRERKPSLDRINTSRSDKEVEDAESASSATRTSTSPAVWSSWRRETGGATSDWASISRNTSGTYQRPGRDSTGIKVLKPASARQTSRSGAAPLPSPGTPQSRFFDEGRRRSGQGGSAQDEMQIPKRSTSREDTKILQQKENMAPAQPQPVPTKPRSVNPIGGASAFGWLNSGSK